MRIGVIFTSFGMSEYLGGSLSPWIEARQSRLGGHEWVIACVSVPFVGYDASDDAATSEALSHDLAAGKVDWVLSDGVARRETEARGLALRWLVERGCDLLWQADGDEIATTIDLSRIVAFVESQPFTVWYSVSLINLVFDTQTRLVDPFTPPRIHRVYAPTSHALAGFPTRPRAAGFWDDNNVYYDVSHVLIPKDIEFASMTIPESVAAPLHYTWLSDDRSKMKCAYQIARWGHCSFRWDEATNRLAFDESYYLKHGLPLPEVARLESLPA